MSPRQSCLTKIRHLRVNQPAAGEVVSLHNSARALHAPAVEVTAQFENFHDPINNSQNTDFPVAF